MIDELLPADVRRRVLRLIRTGQLSSLTLNFAPGGGLGAVEVRHSFRFPPKPAPGVGRRTTRKPVDTEARRAVASP